MYYPQQFFYSHDNKWNEKRLFVDNLFHPVDTHHFYSFGTFLFSAFCTGYIMRGVSFSSEIGWRATISSPCISIRYWSSVIAIASSAERGHRNAPLSSLLYIRRKPSPSQSSALIRSHLLPQKRKSADSKGSISKWFWTVRSLPVHRSHDGDP